MKKIRGLILILSMTCLTLFSGCGQGEVAEKSSITIEEMEGISFYVEDADAISASAVMINSLDGQLSYGNSFALEKDVDGIWYELQVIGELVFTEESYLAAEFSL